VHSNISHLKGILGILADQQFAQPVYIHCFMDGRDTSPAGGRDYLADLEAAIKAHGVGHIATLIGRYYAMDRDKRWPRVKLAYDLLTQGTGQPFSSASAAIEDAYAHEETDEFVKPRVITDQEGQPLGTIQAGDAILFYNFRTDRGRQLTQVLTQEDMPDEGMHTLPLHYATMTRYDESFEGIHVLYGKPNLENGLGEYLSQQGKTQVRIAETEKYAHVTYFFNGGREEAMAGERHLLCPSPKVATYDLQPEMSAQDIRDQINQVITVEDVDFICLNFANADMVGHTGVFEAAVKACETVDACTASVVETANANGYIALVTADHGNSDKMRNPDGSPHTAHTTALVPLFLIDPEQRFSLRPETGKLGDLAPTILTLMGMDRPQDMTGEVLCEPISPSDD
jgi:2,3-bisphosphoglycerate-independent phosphoglycerate mutase